MTVHYDPHADYSVCSTSALGDKSPGGVVHYMESTLGCPAPTAPEWEQHAEEYATKAAKGIQCVQGRVNRMATFSAHTRN